MLIALVSGCLLFARLPVDARTPVYDLLITNARIVDGSGNPRSRADRRAGFHRCSHAQFPVGISYVIVNGAPVFENNQMTAARPGVALRGPGYTALITSNPQITQSQ